MAEIFQQGADPALADMIKKYMLGQTMQTMQNQLPIPVTLEGQASQTQGRPVAPTVEVRGKAPPSLDRQFPPLEPAAVQAAPAVSVPAGDPLTAPAPAEAASGAGWKFPSVPPEAIGGLLRAGLELMQPMPMWQSNTGHLARAAMAGVDYSNEQKKAEQASKVAEAQIAQTGAATEKTRADTKHTGAATEKLVQELEDSRGMHDLRIDELKAKIELSRKQGLLDDAQAKALGQKLEADPKYRGAIIEELQAKAFYYRNPQLRASSGGGSTDPAVLKMVKARTEALKAAGLGEEEAANQAWAEVGTGAAGAKNNAEDQAAARRLRILQYDYQTAMQGSKKPVPFAKWLQDWHAGVTPASDDEKLAPRIREMVIEKEQQASSAAGGGTAPAVKAVPLPTVMGKDGKPITDRPKLVPGTAYILPNGQTYIHQGPAK